MANLHTVLVLCVEEVYGKHGGMPRRKVGKKKEEEGQNENECLEMLQLVERLNMEEVSYQWSNPPVGATRQGDSKKDSSKKKKKKRELD